MGIGHCFWCRFFTRSRLRRGSFCCFFFLYGGRRRRGSRFSSCRRTAEDFPLIGGFQFLLLPCFPGICQSEAVGGAAVGTDAAGDAFLPVNGPGAVSPVYGNSSCRAVMLALAAEQALFCFYPDMGVGHCFRCRFFTKSRLRHGRFCCFFFLYGGRRRRGSRFSSCRRTAEDFPLIGGFQFLLLPCFPGICQSEAVGGTAVGADAAGDAFFPINGPGAVSPVYGNGSCRAVMLAFAAEQALFRFYPDMGIRHSGFFRFHCRHRVLCRSFRLCRLDRRWQGPFFLRRSER